MYPVVRQTHIGFPIFEPPVGHGTFSAFNNHCYTHCNVPEFLSSNMKIFMNPSTKSIPDKHLPPSFLPVRRPSQAALKRDGLAIRFATEEQKLDRRLGLMAVRQSPGPGGGTMKSQPWDFRSSKVWTRCRMRNCVKFRGLESSYENSGLQGLDQN